MNSRSEAPLKTQAKAQESRKTAAAVLGVLASGICAVAAAPPVQNLAAQMADDTPRPRVALTFDDGPHPVYTKRLLDGLQSRGIRATFFVVGENISGSEELIRRKGPIADIPYEDAEAALSFCTYGIVGLLLEYCEKKDVDRERLARQMYRLLTGRMAERRGA